MIGPWQRRAVGGIAAAVACFLMAPTIIVIVMSFSSARGLEFPPPGLGLQSYENLVDDGKWATASANSLYVAALTTAFATTLGTLAAYGVVRGRSRVGALVTAMVISPAVVPIVIVAFGTYLVYTGWGIAGGPTGLILAHTCLAIPFVMLPVASSLRTTDPDLELAAASLGAGPLSTFLRVTLPQLAPGIASGAVFAFIVSWDEVVVALFLTSPTFRTVPVEIYNQLRFTVDPTITAVATLLTVFTTVLFVAGAALNRRAGREDIA